ncbi:MAG TPA: GntR family transcriptional regulator [Streptosporangiales bacterium]
MRPQPGTSAKPSRTRDAYDRLRAAIVTGRLRPNERLVEADLADWLAVSRTPVRECLHRLATEGLVANRRRGWVVHEHTPDEIREVYDLRAALEGFAARLAAERATPEQAAAMERLAAVDPAAYAEPPRTDFVDYNQTFHDTVVATAASGRLADTIRRTREYYFNHRIAAVYTEADVAAALAGHRAIAAAVRDHDAEAAERLTRAHVYEALELAVHKL